VKYFVTKYFVFSILENFWELTMVWNTWQNPMLYFYSKGTALAHNWFNPTETFNELSAKTYTNPISSLDMTSDSVLKTEFQKPW
jgi:hypothetical protein